jgi:hypothetical protein
MTEVAMTGVLGVSCVVAAEIKRALGSASCVSSSKVAEGMFNGA